MWTRYIRHKSKQAYKHYKIARNEYTRYHREVIKKFEKGIIQKVRSQTYFMAT